MASIGKEQHSDSEWEYEYDEIQTEAFYFTLDLPRLKERPTKRRKIDALHGTPFETLEAARESSVQSIKAGKITPQAESKQPTGDPIRFHGLHTTRPSVDYGELRYECRWTTDLGTQFHVSRSGLVKEPRRSGYVVDVVALSRMRLTGANAISIPSKTAAVTNGSESQVVVLDDDEDEGDGREIGSIRGTKRNGDALPQLSFLERVAEIQRRKKQEPKFESNAVDPAQSPLASVAAHSQLVPLAEAPTASNGALPAISLDREEQERTNAPNAHVKVQASATRRASPRDEQNGAAGMDGEPF